MRKLRWLSLRGIWICDVSGKFALVLEKPQWTATLRPGCEKSLYQPCVYGCVLPQDVCPSSGGLGYDLGAVLDRRGHGWTVFSMGDVRVFHVFPQRVFVQLTTRLATAPEERFDGRMEFP